MIESIQLVVITSLLTYSYASTYITCSTRSTSPTTPAPIHQITPGPTSPVGQTPTQSPETSKLILNPDITAGCYNGLVYSKQDVIILNDISCPLTTSQCEAQQRQIANTVTALKDTDAYTPTRNDIPNTRVAYIEFGNTDVDVIISLNHDSNKNPVTQAEVTSFANTIKNASSADCNNANQRESTSNTNPNLLQALQEAINQWDEAKTADKQHDKSVIIYSNCKIDNVEEVCDSFEDQVLNTQKGEYANVLMVNNGENFEEDEYYLYCLVEYDEDRVFMNTDIEDDNRYYYEILPELQNEICFSPTPAPTTDPTIDPTSDPTTKSYRRLADEEDDEDNNYEYSVSLNETQQNSPCITMELLLETENLLPNNMDPNAATNIAIIGKAIGNATGGTIIVPQSSKGNDDNDDDDEEEDDGLTWIMDPECEIDNQVTDTYWPSDVWEVEDLEIEVIDNGDDGFVINVPLETKNSIVYVFKVKSLPLDISHDCSKGDLTMNGAIYKHDELMDETENVIIPAGDESTKWFNFSESVELKASKSYEIRFELINGYPDDCSIEDVSYQGVSLGDISRRRLTVVQYSSLGLDASPNSCTLCAALAQSDSMKTGVTAMCQESDSDTKPVIKEALFQGHSSQSALKNHLFKTGSLHLFDENGTATFNISGFPEYGVKDPCIAVDEEKRIIYAVGGHDGSGSGGEDAVDYIQGYQFDDDTITTGHVIEHLRTWRLDHKRYGSICMHWRKNGTNTSKLIVISGMRKTKWELGDDSDNSKWWNDIVIFTLPTEDASNDGDIMPYQPTSSQGERSTYKDINDGKPLIWDDHILYIFGGKTHKSSKSFVTRFDLNKIAETNNIQDESGMVLTTEKALPLADQVKVNCTEAGDQQEDIKNCYMIFAGQSYDNRELVEDSVELDNLQLFCNENIAADDDDNYENLLDSEDDDRRRLIQDNSPTIPAFSPYDLQMMKKGKRRRLEEGVESPESEILIRTYEYGLDGIWYNFSVEIKLCYDNNEQLKEAEEYYTNIIESRKGDKEEWDEYKENLDEKILNCSIEAYEGWNNVGFGDVDVWNLIILNVSYEAEDEPTPMPTKQPTDGDLSHPERRKARHWWNNWQDKDDEEFEDIVWIDDQFDCDDDE